jgi:hypothetical protein
MNDDVRSYVYGTLIIFIVGVFAWVSFLYLNACGFSLICHRGDLPVYRTPVPTLIPAAMPVEKPETLQELASPSGICEILAEEIVNAWVDSGVSETEIFQFTDANGLTCETTFASAKVLFDDTQELSKQMVAVGQPVK